MRAPAGAPMCLWADEFDVTFAYLGSTPLAAFTGTGAWQRATLPLTTLANVERVHVLVSTCGMVGQAIAFRVDGFQLERGTSPTPYIETSSGPVTRAESSLTAPASLLPLDLGWVAFRARPRWTAATSNQQYPSLLYVGQSVTDKLQLYYYALPGQWSLERNNGMQNPVRSTRAATPGTSVTVVAAWSPTQLFISTDGAPFVSTSASQMPSAGPTTLDLTSLDGEVAWAVFGAGSLNDAQAAALHAFGDADPTFTALPPGAKVLWTADTLAYSVLVGSGATYTPGAADVGSTFRLVVTATNASGTTTLTSAAFGPVVPPSPVSVTAPTLSVSSGGWYAGSMVTATQGTWTGALTFAYQWERCDAMGAACVAATGTGSTTASYTLAAADVGGRMRVTVTATNAGGSTARSSAPAQVVANAPVAFEAVGATASFSAATTTSLARPAGVATGELLLAFLAFSADPGAVTVPAGWSVAAAQLTAASGPRVAAYWALAGANEPPSYAFSWATAATGGGRVASYSGALASNPIAATAVGTTISANRTAVLPSVTPTGAYQRQIGFTAMTTTSSYSTPLGGWSVRASTLGSNPNGAIADRVLATGGASGSTSWTNSAGGSQSGLISLSISLVLRQP